MKKATVETHIFGKDDRPVFRIIIYCLSLAFSVLLASSETVRPSPAGFGFTFEITWRTATMFLIGAGVTIPCFKTLFLSRSNLRRHMALALVILIGLGSFLHPLRFVPSEKFGQIFIGLTIAACVLSGIGAILFLINRFLNEDQRAIEAE